MMTQPLPWQPVLGFDNPSGKEFFPNIAFKIPLVQLEAISPCPVICYLGEETNLHVATPFLQGVVQSDNTTPEPPFF